MSVQPLPVHVDGLVFQQQPHGGISRNFTNLVNALARTPATTPVLYLSKECAWPRGMRAVERREVPPPIRLRPARAFGRLAAAMTDRRSQRFWDSLGQGIFHSSYYSSPDGLRIPQVLSLQDTIYEDFPNFFSSARHMAHLSDKRVAVERSSGLIFSSHFARNRAYSHYELGDRPVLVSPYAVDPVLLEEPTLEEVEAFRQLHVQGRPFFLHVGSRYLHKNVAKLLEAWAGWRGDQDFVLLLAGGGAPEESERLTLESDALRGRVVVLPALDETELRTAYRAAHAFVFPSLSEGFGFPLLEALACGCPVAAARAASLPEVGGDAPHYFDPGSVEDIRRALDAVALEQRSSARWIAARARARSRDWSQVANEYSDFYRLVADRHPSGRQ